MTSSFADELVKWATFHGAYVHPSVEVYRDSVTGLSFRVKPSAQGAVHPYEPIVQLPTAKLSLSALNAESPLNGAKLPPYIVSRLVLVAEFLKAEASFWFPYIQTLPQPDDVEAWALPPFWPPHEAKLLEGTNVDVGMTRVRADVKVHLELIRAELPELEVMADLYRWAYCIFSRRSFRQSLVLGTTRDDFPVLLPLFDLGNHDMTAKVAWQLDSEKGTCALRVDRTHEPGQQVYNNYSMKTNAELLLGYGFMVPPSDALHNDYIHLRKSGTGEEYLISSRPVADASSLLVRARQSLHLRLAPGQRVLGSFRHVQPEMVWDMICMRSTPEELEHLVRVPVGTMMDPESWRQRCLFTAELGGNDDNYQEIVKMLRQTAGAIQFKFLQELESLNETDLEVVGAPPTPNQQLALDYRARCRVVLVTALEAMWEDEIFNNDQNDQDTGEN